MTENVIKQVCYFLFNRHMQDNIFSRWQPKLNHHDIGITFIVLCEPLPNAFSLFQNIFFGYLLLLRALHLKLPNLLFYVLIMHVHELFFLLLDDLAVFFYLYFLSCGWRLMVLVVVNTLLEQIVSLHEFILLILDGFAFLAPFLQLVHDICDKLLSHLLVILFYSLQNFFQTYFPNKLNLLQIINSQHHKVALFLCWLLEVLLEVCLHIVVLNIKNVVQVTVICHSFKLLVCQ